MREAAQTLLDVQPANAETAGAHRAEGSPLLLIELMIAAFVATYVTVVAFGHVLLMAAIYKCPRQDAAGAAAGPQSGRRSQRRRR